MSVASGEGIRSNQRGKQRGEDDFEGLRQADGWAMVPLTKQDDGWRRRCQSD